MSQLIQFKSAKLITRENGTYVAKLYGVGNENSMPYVFTNRLTRITLDLDGKLSVLSDENDIHYARED